MDHGEDRPPPGKGKRRPYRPSQEMKEEVSVEKPTCQLVRSGIPTTCSLTPRRGGPEDLGGPRLRVSRDFTDLELTYGPTRTRLEVVDSLGKAEQ